MRSVSWVADVSINTVTKLLEDAGRACAGRHDAIIVRGVRAEQVRREELWSSRHVEARNLAEAKAASDDAGNVSALVDARAAVPAKRGSYKPRATKAAISN